MIGRPVRDDDDLTVVRSEEELLLQQDTHELGTVRAKKHVDTERVTQVVPRGVEHAEVERSVAIEGDSGQIETLPDGSVSIPVFEEQIVVEKKLVVRERVILRKHTITEDHLVEADLRKERVEIEGLDDLDDATRRRR